jgi:hypothetical protein
MLLRQRVGACSSSVLLPMPGSPPISTTPPGTMPPPSTRSSSSWPVGVRITSLASISASVVTGALRASAWKRCRAPPAHGHARRQRAHQLVAHGAGGLRHLVDGQHGAIAGAPPQA